MGAFFDSRYTSQLQKLIREVVNDPSTYLGSKYMPSIALPVNKIRTEVIEATGGLTNEHALGTDPLYIQSVGSRTQDYAPGSYREAIHYDEKKLLHFRELGQNDPSKRGIRQQIDLDIDRLNRRLEARIEFLRWDTLFSGGFTYMGRTFSFGIPAVNRSVPLTAVWSLDGIGANNSATPIIDIRYWVTGGYAPYRKYKIGKGVMNSNTARWVMDNSNTRSYVQNSLANPTVKAYDINEVLGFFIPGAPPMEIYQGWYQTETLVGDRLVVSDAIYFIPDGYIFWEVASLPGGDKIGEFVQGLHLSTGSIDDPGFGKFLVVDDHTAPGTQGGPKNPYIDLVSGVTGGLKLDRGFDTLTSLVL